MKTIPSATELIGAVRQLALLVQTGFPLPEGLRHVEGQSGPWLEQLAGDMERGDSVAQALNRQPRVFSPYFRHLVEAALACPDPAPVLLALSRWLSAGESMQRRQTTLLFYPTLLVGLALVFLSVGGFVVVPEVLVPLFIEVCGGGSWPLLQTLSSWSGLVPLLLLFPLVLSLVVGRPLALLLRLFPGIQKLQPLAAQSLWARALGSLLAAGVTPCEAVEQSLTAIDCRALRRQLTEVAAQHRRGTPLDQAVSAAGNLHPTVNWALRTPHPAAALLEVADRLERELRIQAAGELNLLAARALLLVSVLIVVVCLAFWWPFYSLTMALPS